MKILMLSFTALARELKQGRVTWADVESADTAFAFGCARRHVFGELDLSPLDPRKGVTRELWMDRAAGEWLDFFGRPDASRLSFPGEVAFMAAYDLEKASVQVRRLRRAIEAAEHGGRAWWRTDAPSDGSARLAAVAGWAGASVGEEDRLRIAMHGWNYPAVAEILEPAGVRCVL